MVTTRTEGLLRAYLDLLNATRTAKASLEDVQKHGYGSRQRRNVIADLLQISKTLTSAELTLRHAGLFPTD